MKTVIPAILLFVLYSLSLSAQETYAVKGSVIDAASDIKLKNTSISVLNQKDSTLVKFTRAAADGTFAVNNLRQGKFILLVTYPGYADYVEQFALDSVKKIHDFGVLNMVLKARLLEAVIVKGEAAAIKIKGDTTEYNASSFKIEPNAKVEDLLKQLPGIQVDKDGKITAQGETVNKVLVDGEEFFGDDPTLVTKNIRGDMVDKVQLYDKKSDQAEFTGIDDGQKTKTLNIKLKADKKNGYFGKVDAGAASDEYYQGQAMFNMFKGKKKFSAYSTIANTGKTGLSWQDNSKYGSSNNVQVTDGGGIMITGGGGDELESFDGRYNNRGIPLAHTGGVHYDSKWNDDKESINANYKIGSLGVKGTSSTLTQNNLPAGIINNNSGQDFDNYIFRHKLDAAYEIKLDSTSSLKVSLDGTLKNNRTRSNYSSASFRGSNAQLNDNSRSISNDGDEQNFNAAAFWKKKLKKTGRTMSLNISQFFNRDEAAGYLNSTSNFYNIDGTIDSINIIDQFKTNDTKSSGFNSNLTYTEPITKSLSLVLNYALGINNSTSDRRSFNKSAGGRYDTLDSLYSNDYRLNQLSNQGGAVFNYNKGKTVINFGTRVTAVDFEQINAFTDVEYKRNFLNWSPQASYQYKFSKQSSFRLNYNGNTTQPNINQIQPVRVNTDPLNIMLGNPDLKPSFTNRLNLGYNSYKVLSERYFSIYGNYSMTMNPIVNNTVTDSVGKSTYQSFNLTDKNPSNFYFNIFYDKKISKTSINIAGYLTMNGNTYYNLINNAMNRTNSYSYSGGINLYSYKPKKYSYRLSFRPSYNTSESSLQKRFNDNGWSFNSWASFSVTLPGKVEISSDANYEFREKTQSFNEDFDRVIWNSAITKKFFKEESFRISFSGNDLLNQNIGFSRSAYNNRITQNSYTTIRRYYMFSIIWDFNKMGGGVPAK